MPNLAPLVKAGSKGVDAIVDALRTFKFPQDDAMRLAQQRAALPVEQGGLGLGPANTASERAAAMGFDTPAFHGTRSDITAFGSPKRAGAGIRSIEQATGLKPTFTTDSTIQASEYAMQANRGKNSSVYPLLINRGEEVGYNFPSDMYLKNRQYLDDEYLRPLGGSEWLDTMPLYHWAKDAGAKSVRMEGVHDGAGASHNFPSTVTAVIDPDNIRSRFAAFDPFRKTAATAAAMGVAAPDLLAQELRKK